MVVFGIFINEISFVSIVIFILGMWGVFSLRKNLILLLISIELMLLAINLNLTMFSVYLDDQIGQVFALFVLTVAAAESSIGLAILVTFYRLRGLIAIDYINSLKG